MESCSLPAHKKEKPFFAHGGACFGLFEAVVYYTLAPENTGTVLQLSFGDSKLAFGIYEAHNPPLEGMEYDRVKREESYVKDFKPITAGQIYLEKGKGKLMLETLNIPGSTSIDFRQLTLNRIE